MGGVESVNKRLLAADCLRTLKRGMTFRELTKETGMPAGVLSRYISGSVLPKDSRASSILKHFERIHFRQALIDESHLSDSRFLVTSTILSNPFYLRFIASQAAHYFPEKVDAVLAAAVDGIPLAVTIAEFKGARVIYAKQTQEFSFAGHYTSTLPTAERPLETPFFLPKELLNKNDKVLIVDDVVRGGRTLQALISICEQAKADIVGIYAIFSSKSALKRMSTHKMGALMTLPE